MKALLIILPFFASLALGCSSNSALVARALEQSESERNDASNRLMLANHFSSTLPAELNADYHAILRVPGFSQRSWSISDPKARLWCVEATQESQKAAGKIDKETNKGLISVDAVKARCSPLLETKVDVEHMCVTVEEPKKHFIRCTVEAQITVKRYKVDMDGDMNFRYQPDTGFAKDGIQQYKASKDKKQDVLPSDDLVATTRTLLEVVSSDAAMAVHEKIHDANALSR